MAKRFKPRVQPPKQKTRIVNAVPGHDGYHPSVPRSKDASGWTYFLAHPVTGRVKIGCTRSPRVEDRLSSIQTSSDHPLILLGTAHGQRIEPALHALLVAHRVHREWFEPSAEALAEMDAAIDRGGLDC